MDCKTAYSMIHDFLDGTLGPEQRKAFDAHVARCPNCAREVGAYRSLDRLLGRMEFEDVPAGFAEPVIRFLKATGRIQDRVVGTRAGRARAGVVWWIPPRFRIPAAACAVLVVVLSAISIGSGRFVGLLGKSTVAAATAYADVQQTASNVAVLDDVSQGLEQDVRTVKTIANAVYLLLSAAGQTYLVPALLVLFLSTAGAAWYIKTFLKRSAENASFCV